MREHARALKTAMKIDGLHEVDSIEIEHTDAIHARVYGEMILRDHTM